MQLRDVRFSSVVRCAIAGWIVYCVAQMIRWRLEDDWSMVAGWFWIGTIWGCLLSVVRKNLIRVDEFAVISAISIPVCFLGFPYFRDHWAEMKVSVWKNELGPVWVGVFFCVCFDIAVLLWGLKRRYVFRYLSIVIAICLIAAGRDSNFETVCCWLIAAIVLTLTVCLMNRSQGAQAPRHIVPAATLLTGFDLVLLTSVYFKPQSSGNWLILALARMVVVAFMGWRLSATNRQNEMVHESQFGFRLKLPFRSLQVFAIAGCILWTLQASWLYPRVIVVIRDRIGQESYLFWVPSDRPANLSEFPLLADIWQAANTDFSTLLFSDGAKRVPEMLFANGDVKQIETWGPVNDDLLNFFWRFPSLSTITIDSSRRITRAGLESLARCPRLTKLEIWNNTLSLKDFACFDAHQDLDLILNWYPPSRTVDERQADRRGMIAMSSLKSVDLRIRTVCDEEFARQLCEIQSLRRISLSYCDGITGPTLKRLVSGDSLVNAAIRIRNVGESISLQEIADAVEVMPDGSRLFLICKEKVLNDADVVALERMGESLIRSGSRSESDEAQEATGDCEIALSCTVLNDDHFARLCAIRTFSKTRVKAIGISEQGLKHLSFYQNWENWRLSLDLTASPSPAHLWTHYIPRELARQIVLTPDSLLTEEDAKALESLSDSAAFVNCALHDQVFLQCQSPTIPLVERLKWLDFNGRVVLDLSASTVTRDELLRIVKAIQTTQLTIDLRLPGSLEITGQDAAIFVELGRLDYLYLAAKFDDSAMPMLERQYGLLRLDVRDSNLGSEGLYWLKHCENLESLRIVSTANITYTLQAIARCSSRLQRVEIVRPRIDIEFLNALKELRDEWEVNHGGDLISVALIDAEILVDGIYENMPWGGNFYSIEPDGQNDYWLSQAYRDKYWNTDYEFGPDILSGPKL